MPTFTSALRTAVLFVTLFILNIHLSAQNTTSSPSDKISKEQSAVKKKILKPTEIFSQRKNKIKGHARYDDPDMFVEFQKMIRTREGESSPRYSQNYLMEEYSKAVRSSSLSKTGAILNWIERGPGNVSGRTRGLVIDRSDSTKKTWWAGSVGGGIWKTTDMGANWTNKSPDLPNLATTVIIQSFSNPDIFYCGTGEGFFNADAIKGSGIFKSTDHGNSWFQLPSAASFDFYCVNRMLADPSDPDIVIAGTRSGPNSSLNPGGIQRSTDGGQTWARVYRANYQQGVQDLRPDPTDFNIIYASSYMEGVLKSTDKGLTWTKLSQGLTFTGRIEIAVSPIDPKVIWASAVTQNGSGLYYSANGAQSWDLISPSDGKTYNWLNTQGWYDNTMEAHPFDAKTVFFGGIDVWRATLASTPNTASFIPVTDGYRQYGKPYVHPDQHNIVMIPISETLKQFWILNANDGGVAYSTNGGASWVSALSGGYNTTQFYGVDKMPGQSKYIGGTQDNGTWLAQKINPDKTTNYTSVIGGDGFEVSWHYKDPLKILGGSQYNNFYKTTNGGTNWISATNGLSDVGSGKGCFISKIGESNSDPDIIYTTGSKGIWRSENFGDSWTLCDITSRDWTYNGTSTPVSVSIADANVVWAGHSFSNSSSRLYMSSDHGLSFKSVKPYSGAALGTLTGIDTHPLDPKTAYLTFSIANAPKILKTTDLGETWTDISGFGTASKSSTGFPNVATFCVVVMPYNTKIIWAGTEIGLFESTDDGASWHLANNGLPAVCIWDMKVVDNEVILATHGRGIFSVALPELDGYKPPAITLTPLIKKTYQTPAGSLVVETSIRDLYDSLQVTINGNVFSSINKPLVSEKSFTFTVTKNDTFRIQLAAYKGGMIYKSSANTMLVYQLRQAQAEYVNDFNSASSDFAGSDFTITAPAGFSNGALHSPHPYKELNNYIHTLLVPVKVASSNAFVEYDDIAVVEPGDPGYKFGSTNFWDYVVIEASKDGNLWTPIEDGYDCNFNSKWLTLWNNPKQSVDSTAFLHHKVNLLNKFAAGDVIMLRFFLFSDPASYGWGWAIDNLRIQKQTAGINDKNLVPSEFSLSQNFPNPFNPVTTIKYTLTSASHVSIKVYDALGQEIRVLVDAGKPAGSYELKFDAKDLPSGSYYYTLKAGDYTDTKKMIILK